ncbi:MAG: hypothetical protein ABI859_01570 [Pseudomonadota bacterium]
MHSSPRTRWIQSALAIACGAVAPALSNGADAPSVRPDFSGFWELRADSKHVTPALLTPLAKQAMETVRPKVEKGDILTHASRWCQPLGTPFIMGDSAPLDLVQSKYELAIMAEVQSSARHIYLDGRKHPDPEIFDQTTNGHSVGRFENQALVVDTVGFNDKGNPSVPGGGVRGPGTHLVERFELIEGGKQLRITFTWTDPKYFTKPHSYDFVYYRDPPETYAFEYFCDASDPNRPKTAQEPPQ